MAEQNLTPPGGQVRRVCYPFPGDAVGGSHITAALLIRGLDRSLFEPVVVLHQEGRLGRYLREKGIAYQVLPLAPADRRRAGLANLLGLAGVTPGLASFLRRERIALVHSTQNFSAQNWALACRLAGTRHLWAQAGRIMPSRVEHLLRLTAHGIFVNSRFMLRQLPPRLQRRCRIIPPPFNVDQPAPDRAAARGELLAEIGAGEETRLVGFFGNLLEVKRPEVFLEAARVIDRELPGGCAFVLFGDDRQNRAAGLLERGRALGLDSHVHYMGFRRPGSFWMAACDLILVPAVGETFGRVLVEAMLAGTPVAASDSGGHPEIIDQERTGLLAPPDDAHALGRAGARLLRDRALARDLAARAAREAPRRFSKERYIQSIQDLYQELLDRPGRP